LQTWKIYEIKKVETPNDRPVATLDRTSPENSS